MRTWSPCTRSSGPRLRGPIESAQAGRGTSVPSAVGGLSGGRRGPSLAGVQPMPPGIERHHRRVRPLEGIVVLDQAQPHPITRRGSIVE